ncbi:hypothetical protein [Salinimicrobium soli]|uniref:hypothetical protein n=1 Tax=Salinimicrobium soli TaxID=1254399 RepID=UPI003AAD20F1
MSNLLRKFPVVFVVLFILAGCAKDEIPPNEKPLGTSSQDFLTDDRYTSMTLEIVYVEGFAPTAAALTELENFLNTYLYKPDGIRIVTNSIPSPGVGDYSLQEVKQVESTYRSVFSSGTNLGVFIFFADNYSANDAASAGNGGIDKRSLGTAYRNTSIVIYERSVLETGGNRSTIEHTTLRHEFGHLFGLVNNGTPAQSAHEYKDPNNSSEKGHCNVSGCLMSPTLDFSKGTMQLGSKCHEDLIANGGK